MNYRKLAVELLRSRVLRCSFDLSIDAFHSKRGDAWTG